MTPLVSRMSSDPAARDLVLSVGCLLLIVALYVAWFPFQVLVLFALLAIGASGPRSIVIATPATIGLAYQPVELRDLMFNPIEIGVALSVAALGLHTLLTRTAILPGAARSCHRLRENLTSDRFGLILACAFLATGILSLLTVADPGFIRESARQFRWVVAVPVAFFLLATAIIPDGRGRLLLAASFVLGGVIAATAAIVELLAGGGLDVDSVTRASGFAPHPNALALYIERVLVFTIGIAILIRHEVSRWAGVAAVIVLLALIMTFSRGAFIAVALATVAVLYVGRERRLAGAVAIAATVFGAVLVALAPDRLLRIFDGGSGSLRIELWRSSIQMIQDNALFGVGLDQFLYQYLPRYVTPAAWPERFTSHPHQIILDAWLNLGIIGVLFGVAYGVFAVQRSWSAIQMTDSLRLAALGGLLAGLVHGLFDNSYFLPDLALSFWLLTVLLTESDRSDASDSPSVHS